MLSMIAIMMAAVIAFMIAVAVVRLVGAHNGDRHDGEGGAVMMVTTAGIVTVVVAVSHSDGARCEDGACCDGSDVALMTVAM